MLAYIQETTFCKDLMRPYGSFKSAWAHPRASAAAHVARYPMAYSYLLCCRLLCVQYILKPLLHLA